MNFLAIAVRRGPLDAVASFSLAAVRKQDSYFGFQLVRPCEARADRIPRLGEQILWRLILRGDRGRTHESQNAEYRHNRGQHYPFHVRASQCNTPSVASQPQASMGSGVIWAKKVRYRLLLYGRPVELG